MENETEETMETVEEFTKRLNIEVETKYLGVTCWDKERKQERDSWEVFLVEKDGKKMFLESGFHKGIGNSCFG